MTLKTQILIDRIVTETSTEAVSISTTKSGAMA